MEEVCYGVLYLVWDRPPWSQPIDWSASSDVYKGQAYKGLTEEEKNFLAKTGQITDTPVAVKKPAYKKEEEQD